MNAIRLQICLFGGEIAWVFCVLGRQVNYDFTEMTMQTLAHMVANHPLLGFSTEAFKAPMPVVTSLEASQFSLGGAE